MPPGEFAGAARVALEELDHSVEEGARVEDLNGFEHSFTLLARGERVVRASIARDRFI